MKEIEMTPDPLTDEIMFKIHERTNRADHLRLSTDQYNAVYEAVHAWIYEGGEKIRKMLDQARP